MYFTPLFRGQGFLGDENRLETDHDICEALKMLMPTLTITAV